MPSPKNWLKIAAGGILVTATLFLATCAGFVSFGWKSLKPEQPTESQLFDMPIRAKWMKRDHLDWLDWGSINQISDEFIGCGFERIGDFEVSGMEHVRTRIFRHPKESLILEIYEIGSPRQSQITYVLTSAYADDRSVVYHNNSWTVTEWEPLTTAQFCTESPRNAYAKLLRERPHEHKRDIPPDEVVTFLESAYARGIDFLLSRGGYSASELRAYATKTGSIRDDAQIEEYQTIWRREAAAKVDAFVLANAANDSSLALPPNAIPNGKVFCVHDLLDTATLIDRVERIPTTRERQELDEWSQQLIASPELPRARFAKAVNAMPTEIAPRLAGSVTVPIPCDIYVLK